MRLAVDIGGTFTDVVLEHAGRLLSTKVPTTPRAPEEGFLEGAQRLLNDAGVDPTEVSTIIHGTTLATNALTERKAATTALITTEGFRDTLEIGYESRFDQYDIFLDKPAPLVPRHLRYTVVDRINAKGRVLTPLCEAEVRALVPDTNDCQQPPPTPMCSRAWRTLADCIRFTIGSAREMEHVAHDRVAITGSIVGWAERSEAQHPCLACWAQRSSAQPTDRRGTRVSFMSMGRGRHYGLAHARSSQGKALCSARTKCCVS